MREQICDLLLQKQNRSQSVKVIRSAGGWRTVTDSKCVYDNFPIKQVKNEENGARGMTYWYLLQT